MAHMAHHEQPEQSEPFALIASYHTDEPVIDKWTHVFNERNPSNGYWTMLATDNTGFRFSQFCEGMYTPDGDNSHLGNEVCLLIGSALHKHVLARMHAGEEL